jgi:hypothetical protein
MTSVLRLGVYRERIEKYGAGSGGCRRQVAQPQQDTTSGSPFNESTRTTFPVDKANNNTNIQQNSDPSSGLLREEANKINPSSSTTPNHLTSHRAQPAIVEQGGQLGKGNTFL